jgi:uncharacterized protein YigE (DUF2233 family)
MVRSKIKYATIAIVCIATVIVASLQLQPKHAPHGPEFKSKQSEGITSVTIDPRRQQLQLFWRDPAGSAIGSIEALRDQIEARGRKLMFATNAGMFHADLSPVGLLIQEGRELHPLNTDKGEGNFFLKPNGVFYLTSSNNAVICRTEDMPHSMKGIRLATQSGPLLLEKGKIHPAFQKDSRNANIRNGVGVLPNGHVVFAISTSEVNFYAFANYFRERGCSNALYLDGFVSRMYAPSKNILQTEGEVGAMIGITE